LSRALKVIPTGTANLASVLAAFRRLGATPEIAQSAAEVALAGRVVLPGVGSFGTAIEELDRQGMRSVLRERLIEGRPTLAVCVGMQLLATISEESQGAAGIAIVPGGVKRFPDSVKVPQLGWNRVTAEPGCRFVITGWAYFANSYRLEEIPEGWVGATTNHGGRFVSALERGDVLACQFHPELSGPWGAGILGSWLDATGKAT